MRETHRQMKYGNLEHLFFNLYRLKYYQTASPPNSILELAMQILDRRNRAVPRGRFNPAEVMAILLACERRLPRAVAAYTYIVPLLNSGELY